MKITFPLMLILALGAPAAAELAAPGLPLIDAAAVRGSVAETESGFISASRPAPASAEKVDWVAIPGGRFMMGSSEALPFTPADKVNSLPVHQVSVKGFLMSRADVTVEQYAQCVAAGACSEPVAAGPYCNWGKEGRGDHPVNCVSWDQAERYAEFAGGRLPTEAEWEYAASGAGRSHNYPWGDAEPTCDNAVTVGCSNSTLPVCSKPQGNTPQGLCDMAGNVWQWVQDSTHDSYAGAPADGSEWKGGDESFRVVRGGSFDRGPAAFLKVSFRGKMPRNEGEYLLGFRLAK